MMKQLTLWLSMICYFTRGKKKKPCCLNGNTEDHEKLLDFEKEAGL